MMSVCTQQQPEETLKRLHIYIGKIINGHRIGNQHLLCAKCFQCFQNSLCPFFMHNSFSSVRNYYSIYYFTLFRPVMQERHNKNLQ